VTDGRHALEVGTVDDLRASVGDDPALLSELLDDVPADAPPLDSLRAAVTNRRIGAGEHTALCRHVEGPAPRGGRHGVRSLLDDLDDARHRVGVLVRA
jgi:hypothetical protein